jgi:hypothetical protein
MFVSVAAAIPDFNHLAFLGTFNTRLAETTTPLFASLFAQEKGAWDASAAR